MRQLHLLPTPAAEPPLEDEHPLRSLVADLVGEDVARVVSDAQDPVSTLLREDLGDLSPAQARKLGRLRELFRSVTEEQLRVAGELLDRPELVAQYVAAHFWKPDQEVMGALYVDVRHRMIGSAEVFWGTLSRAAVEPRPLLTKGLRMNAAGVLLWHTHPSGQVSPSPEDIAFTERFSEAAEIVGVRLVDHIIVGGPGVFLSLKRSGHF